MTDPPTDQDAREIARLATELEEAELYEQRLRCVIAAVREELTRGHVERALSMLNEALNEIDAETDVVARAPERPQGSG